MIDITQRKELVDILEEVYDTSSSSSDIIKGARQRIKEAKTMMKDWAERNEFDAEVVDNVYREYASYRKGKAKWGEDDEKDNLFVELLVAVQDAVIEKKGT
jgi:hypothetical protein